MYTIPISVVGVPEITRAQAATQQLAHAIKDTTEAAVNSIATAKKNKQALTEQEKAVLKLNGQIERFSRETIRVITQQKELLSALNAPTDAILRQARALQKAQADVGAYSKSYDLLTIAAKNSLAMKRAEAVAMEKAGKLYASNAVQTRLLTDTIYQAGLVSKIELDTKQKILTLRARELSALEMSRAKLTALTQTERESAAANREVLRLKEQLARATILESAQVKSLAGTLKGVTDAKRNETAVEKELEKIKQQIAKLRAQEDAGVKSLSGTLTHLTDAKRNELAVERESTRLKEQLARLRALEDAEIKKLTADVRAATDAQRNQAAVDKEVVRLKNAIAVALAKTDAEVLKYAADLAKLTGVQQRNNVVTKQATADQLRLQTNLHVTNQLTASLRAGLSGLGTSFGMYTSSTILMATAVYGFFRALKDTIATGAAYQDLLARVGAISTSARAGTDEYTDSLDRLNQKALAVSASTRFTATQTLEAMKELAMAGLSVDNIITAVESTMRLAAIGMISYGEAADIATNVMMGFGMEVVSLSHIVDVLAASVTNSNQNIAQIGNAMSYAAPVAESMGISLEFVAAATQVLANSGIKASRAGTGLRRIFISLFAPTEKASDLMTKYGMSVTSVKEGMEELEHLENPIKGLFNEAASGTDVFIAKLKEFYIATDGARGNIDLLKEAVGVRALPAFIQLIRGLEKGEDGLLALTEALKEAGGAAEDMFTKISQSLKSDWEVLVGAFEAAKLKIYDKESSGIQDLIRDVTLMAQNFAGSEKVLDSFIRAVKATMSAVVEFIKILAVLKLAMGVFAVAQWAIPVVAGLATVITTTSKAIALAAGTIGLFNTVLGATAAGALTLSIGLSLLKTAVLAVAKFALPITLVGGAIALVADKLFNISGVISEFFGAKKAFDQATQQETKRRLDEINYIRTEGMKTLMDERRLLEEQIATYSDISSQTDEQVAALGRHKQRLFEINEQLTAMNKKMAEGAEILMRNDLRTARAAVEKAEEDVRRAQEELERRRATSRRESLGVAIQPAESTNRNIANILAAQTELNAKKAIQLELEQQIALLTKDMAGIKKGELSISAEIATLEKEVRHYQNLLEAIPDALSPAYLELKKHIETLIDQKSELNKVLSESREASQSYARTLLPLADYETAYAKLISNRVQVLKDARKSELEQLADEAKTAQQRKALLDQQITSMQKAIQVLLAYAKAHDEPREAMENVQHLYQTLAGLMTDGNEATETATEATEAYNEALKKHQDAIESLHGKYDPIAKMQYGMAEAFEEIEQLIDAGEIGLDRYGDSLLNVAGTILEVDDKTGKLTKTSVDLINKMIEATKVTMAKAIADSTLLKVLHALQIQTIANKVAMGDYAAATQHAVAAAATAVAIQGNENDIAQMTARLGALDKVLKHTFKTQNEGSKSSRAAEKAAKDLAKSYKELAPTLENYNKLLKLSNETTDEGKAAMERFYEIQEILIRSGEDLNYVLPKNAEELQKLVFQYDKAKEGLGEYNFRMAEANALLQAGDISASAHAKSVDEIRLAYARSQGPIAEYFEQLRQEAKLTEGDLVDVIDSFRTSFIDSLVDGEANFDGFVDNIKKKLLELAINTIIINFAGNILGVNGGGGVAGQAMSAVTGGGSGVGGLSNIGNFFGGNSMGAGIGSSLTWATSGGQGALYAPGWAQSMAGGLAATPNWALGVGSIGGGLAGNALFGDKGYGSVGSSIGSTAGAIIGSILPGIGTIIGGFLGGIGGGFLGSLFGGGTPKIKWNEWNSNPDQEGLSRDDYKNMDDEMKNQARAVTNALNESLINMRDALGKDGKLPGVSAAFENYQLPDNTTQLKNLEAMTKDVFLGVSEAMVLAWAETEVAPGMGDMIKKQFEGLELGDMESFDEMQTAIAGLVAELEALPAMSDAFAVLGLRIGDTETASYATIFALSELYDGMQNLAASQEFYYQNFFSEEERRLQAIETAKNKLSEWNSTLSLTGEAAIDTKEEFRSYIESLDLTTEAGRDAYKAAMDLAPSVVNLVTGLKELETEVDDTVAALLKLGFAYHAQSQEVEDLANKLIGYADSQEEMNGLLDYFYENFYSEEEKRKASIEAAKQTILGFNFEMGFFGESMIDRTWQLREFIFAQDASTEAGQRNILAALRSAEAFVTLANHMTGLASGIKSVADSVNDMITGARTEVENFGLTNKQLFDKNKAEIEAIERSMQTMTQPLEIERAAQRIMQLHQDSWALLDDSQKKSMKAAFLGYFADLDIYVADQLKRIAGLNNLPVGGETLGDLSVNLQTIISSYEGAIEDLRISIQSLSSAADATGISAKGLQNAAGEIVVAARAMPTAIDVTVNMKTTEVG